MYFAIALLIITIACSTITVRTLVGYFDIRFIWKFILSATVALSWLSPLLINFLRKKLSLQGEIYAELSNIGYFLFGLAFILFIVLFARDVFWYFAYGISKLFAKDITWLNPQNLQSLKYANIVAVFMSFGVAFYATYSANKTPDVKEVLLSSDKVNKDVKIVQLSDIHITRGMSLKRLQKIVERTNALSADAIVLTGDIIDDNALLLNKYFAELKKLKAKDGVFFVIGNHEYYNGIVFILKKVQEVGLKNLHNSGKSLANKNVYIGGVPDKSAAFINPYFAIDIKKAVKNSKDGEYKILLSHNPQIFQDENAQLFDLVLSGHTHGGQIFPFNYLAKKANTYLAGLYEKNGKNLYVSRGVGYWGPPMRFLAPAEITLIKISPKKSS